MKRVRAKNIADADIAEIVSILDGWSGKLGWDLLIDAIEHRHGHRYSRQALDKHERIKQAFVQRKKALSGTDGEARKVSSPELQMALERIQRVTAENERLTKENTSLLEQFVRWAYNASLWNVGQDKLNQPLPRLTASRQRRSLRLLNPKQTNRGEAMASGQQLSERSVKTFATWGRAELDNDFRTMASRGVLSERKSPSSVDSPSQPLTRTHASRRPCGNSKIPCVLAVCSPRQLKNRQKTQQNR